MAQMQMQQAHIQMQHVQHAQHARHAQHTQHAQQGAHVVGGAHPQAAAGAPGAGGLGQVGGSEPMRYLYRQPPAPAPTAVPLLHLAWPGPPGLAWRSLAPLPCPGPGPPWLALELAHEAVAHAAHASARALVDLRADPPLGHEARPPAPRARAGHLHAHPQRVAHVREAVAGAPLLALRLTSHLPHLGQGDKGQGTRAKGQVSGTVVKIQNDPLPPRPPRRPAAPLTCHRSQAWRGCGR
jgi:hypothetical protein